MPCIGVLLDKGGRKHEVSNYFCGVADHRRKSLDCAFNKGDGMKETLKLALEALERYQVKRQDFDTFEDVITAIKAALAQPVQTVSLTSAGYIADEDDDIQVYQRPWVGLTDREKSNLWLESRAAIPRFHTYASLIEAKLKEKNT
jgi:hypothetical protein